MSDPEEKPSTGQIAIEPVENSTVELVPVKGETSQIMSTTDQGKEDLLEKYSLNHCYILTFTLVVTLGASFQGGFALAENGQVGFVFQEKMEWETGGFINNLTILTVCGSLGLAIGSIAGGSLASSLGGIRRTLLFSNIVAIVSCGLKCIEWFPALIAGRLLFGICCGAQQFCMSKALNDTVPVKSIQLYSQFINGGLGIGVFVSNLMGFLIPILDEEDPQTRIDLKEDTNWRLIYGCSSIAEVLTLIIITMFYSSISLSGLISDGKVEEAKAMVKKIYKLSHLGQEGEDKAAGEIV